jgi:hypothetical protein
VAIINRLNSWCGDSEPDRESEGERQPGQRADRHDPHHVGIERRHAVGHHGDADGPRNQDSGNARRRGAALHDVVHRQGGQGIGGGRRRNCVLHIRGWRHLRPRDDQGFQRQAGLDAAGLPRWPPVAQANADPERIAFSYGLFPGHIKLRRHRCPLRSSLDRAGNPPRVASSARRSAKSTRWSRASASGFRRA